MNNYTMRARKRSRCHTAYAFTIVSTGILCASVLLSCNDAPPPAIDTRAPSRPIRVDQLSSSHDELVTYSLMATNPNRETVHVVASIDVDGAVYSADGGSINDDGDFVFYLDASGTTNDSKRVNISFPTPEGDDSPSRVVTFSTRDELGNQHKTFIRATFKPDLTITDEPTIIPDTIRPNGRFSISVRVTNTGHTATVKNFQMVYYVFSSLSSRGAIVGHDTVAPLAARESELYQTTLQAPNEEGVFYYRACLVSTIPEVEKTNNCSPMATIRVDPSAEVAKLPDFTVSSFALRSGEHTISLNPGATFEVQTTVRNNGAASGSGQLRYVRSEDNRISASSARESNAPISALAVDATSEPYSLTITAPTDGGVYYYGACVAQVAGEINTDNNCSATTVKVTITAPKLRLSLGDNSLSDRVGKAFTTRVVIRNVGTAKLASGARLTIRSSSNSAIGITDSIVGDEDGQSMRAIMINDSAEYPVATPVLRRGGVYYYGVCITYTPPSSTQAANICSAGIRITVNNPFIGTWTGSNLGVTVTNTYTADKFTSSFTAVSNPNRWTCDIEYGYDTYNLTNCTGTGNYGSEVEGRSSYRIISANRIDIVTAANRRTIFTRSR